jgi:CubicO group peptidase (beta-lactamase class C family)
MKIKIYLIPALVVFAMAAIIRRAFARPAAAKPASSTTRYDGIDAYIEGKMRRLKIPGVSLAIVEGDQIVHLRGFGHARPEG